eukprot:Lankesteria_metandrocarpae@DN4198_c0_g1_i1.p1
MANINFVQPTTNTRKDRVQQQQTQPPSLTAHHHLPQQHVVVVGTNRHHRNRNDSTAPNNNPQLDFVHYQSNRQACNAADVQCNSTATDSNHTMNNAEDLKTSKDFNTAATVAQTVSDNDSHALPTAALENSNRSGAHHPFRDSGGTAVGDNANRNTAGNPQQYDSDRPTKRDANSTATASAQAVVISNNTQQQHTNSNSSSASHQHPQQSTATYTANSAAVVAECGPHPAAPDCNNVTAMSQASSPDAAVGYSPVNLRNLIPQCSASFDSWGAGSSHLATYNNPQTTPTAATHTAAVHQSNRSANVDARRQTGDGGLAGRHHHHLLPQPTPQHSSDSPVTTATPYGSGSDASAPGSNNDSSSGHHHVQQRGGAPTVPDNRSASHHHHHHRHHHHSLSAPPQPTASADNISSTSGMLLVEESPGAIHVGVASSVGFSPEAVSSFQRHVRFFYEECRVDEVVPEHSRILALDIRMHVHTAFQCLLEYNKFSATLYDEKNGSFVGVFDSFELMHYLLHVWNFQNDANYLQRFYQYLEHLQQAHVDSSNSYHYSLRLDPSNTAAASTSQQTSGTGTPVAENTVQQGDNVCTGDSDTAGGLVQPKHVESSVECSTADRSAVDEHIGDNGHQGVSDDCDSSVDAKVSNKRRDVCDSSDNDHSSSHPPSTVPSDDQQNQRNPNTNNTEALNNLLMIAPWDYSLEFWRKVSGRPQIMPCITHRRSCLEALQMLLDTHLPQISVWSEKLSSPLSFISIPLIVAHLVQNLRGYYSVFDQNIRQLKIGRYGNIVALPLSTPLKQVVGLIRDNQWSSVPLLDDEGCYVGCFGRKHFLYFVARAFRSMTFLDLEQPVSTYWADLFAHSAATSRNSHLVTYMGYTPQAIPLLSNQASRNGASTTANQQGEQQESHMRTASASAVTSATGQQRSPPQQQFMNAGHATDHRDMKVVPDFNNSTFGTREPQAGSPFEQTSRLAASGTPESTTSQRAANSGTTAATAGGGAPQSTEPHSSLVAASTPHSPGGRDHTSSTASTAASAVPASSESHQHPTKSEFQPNASPSPSVSVSYGYPPAVCDQDLTLRDAISHALLSEGNKILFVDASTRHVTGLVTLSDLCKFLIGHDAGGPVTDYHLVEAKDRVPDQQQ